MRSNPILNTSSGRPLVRIWAAPLALMIPLACWSCTVTSDASDAGVGAIGTGGTSGKDAAASGTGGASGQGTDAATSNSGGTLGTGGGASSDSGSHAGDASALIDAALDGNGSADGAARSDSSNLDGSTMVEGGGASDALRADAMLGDTGILVGEVLGFYSGDWGDMVLRQVGNEVWGVYDHDQGTIVGTVQGGALVGWWSEVPSRSPSNDAGEVEFRWVRTDAGGGILLDGRWKYGTNDSWREDWDIGLVTDRQPSSELLARFNDPNQFPRHP